MKKINMVLYGANLTGKTTFAVNFPNHHVISLDGNAQYVTDSFTNVNSYAEFDKAFKVQDKEGNVIIIDTANILLNWVRMEYLKKKGIEYESDANDMGKSWALVKHAHLTMMDNLTNHSKASVIFLFHETQRLEEDSLGIAKTVYSPIVPNAKIVGELMASMTIIGRTFRSKGNYGIDFGSKDEFEFTGARMPHSKKVIKADLESFRDNFPLVFSDEKTAQKKD